ncbi:Ubiquitin carboxyl-terminal hydrolase [Trichinella spiralis]|uniref:Ubiquitin carboxyl-terminal hydrolase n=1 Tax=Trichinella spiralis TaxID=6334 RepID=A0ABR3KBP0_TRISP
MDGVNEAHFRNASITIGSLTIKLTSACLIDIRSIGKSELSLGSPTWMLVFLSSRIVQQCRWPKQDLRIIV